MMLLALVTGSLLVNDNGRSDDQADQLSDRPKPVPTPTVQQGMDDEVCHPQRPSPRKKQYVLLDEQNRWVFLLHPNSLSTLGLTWRSLGRGTSVQCIDLVVSAFIFEFVSNFSKQIHHDSHYTKNQTKQWPQEW